MWLMMQYPEPRLLCWPPGNTFLREFAERAFARVDREIVWEGSGNQERGMDRKSGQTLIEVGPVYFRPTEVDMLLADPTKAKKRLGWTYKTTFDQLISEMVDADLQQRRSRDD